MTDKGERIEKIGHWGECDRCNTEHFNEGQIKELGFEYLCAKCIRQIKREAAEKVIACCPDYPSENCHGQCNRLIEEAKQEVKKETLCPNHDNRPKIFCSKCADTIKENAFKEGGESERRDRFQYIDKWQKEFRKSNELDLEYARQKMFEEIEKIIECADFEEWTYNKLVQHLKALKSKEAK